MNPEAFSGSVFLSVVVPVYNVAEFLEECLSSVLAYPGADLEVIAVNDASPDESGAILTRYSAEDSRLKVITLGHNVGLGLARNRGIEEATGQYVWFVDADDWLPDGSVGRVIQRLRAARPDVLIVDHATAFPDGEVAPQHVSSMVSPLPDTPVSLSECPKFIRVAHSACTKVASRRFLDEYDLRFLPGLYEDSSFSHPLLMTATSIDVLPEICYYYRQRPAGGITSTVSTRHFEVFGQYEQLFARMDADPQRYDRFRPELFRAMINHYLVIVGHEKRLSNNMRRAFFSRIADHYGRFHPGAYDRPGGTLGLKHRLVQRDLYLPFSAIRIAYRTLSGRGSGSPAIPRQRAGSADAEMSQP